MKNSLSFSPVPLKYFSSQSLNCGFFKEAEIYYFWDECATLQWKQVVLKAAYNN